MSRRDPILARVGRAGVAGFVFVLGGLFPVAGQGTAVPVRQTTNETCVVTVAAASDLSFVLDEIATKFQMATGCQVRVSTGSSGNFLTQIENGAPFDVFFSADIEYPKKLDAEGLAAPDSLYVYAVGKIVLWARKDSGLDMNKGLEVLRDPSVKHLAIANPAHAPYGRAAEEALRRSGMYDAVKDRLVLGENISQAAEFVESGSADAGILAQSLALSPALKDKGVVWPFPESSYSPIRQAAVIIRRAPNLQGGREFLDFVKKPATSELLERNGFALPAKAKP